MKCTLEEWQKIIKPKESLIVNSSDSKYMTDEWVPYTIGLACYIMNYNGDLKSVQIGDHNNLVFCSFHKGTDGRRRITPNKNRELIAINLEKNNIKNCNRLSHSDYFLALPSYKFVVSPEGNGIDCHRHYEALMAGCIPIIEECDGIKEKYGNCPILYTDDYSEITEEYLNKKYEEMLHKEWDFSKLFLENYSKEHQEEIKASGNYWSQTIIGRKWYN